MTLIKKTTSTTRNGKSTKAKWLRQCKEWIELEEKTKERIELNKPPKHLKFRKIPNISKLSYITPYINDEKRYFDPKFLAMQPPNFKKHFLDTLRPYSAAKDIAKKVNSKNGWIKY